MDCFVFSAFTCACIVICIVIICNNVLSIVVICIVSQNDAVDNEKNMSFSNLSF